MPPNNIVLLAVILAGFFFLSAVPALAQQQANLNDIGNATVTLYYYDNVSGTKGDIVPMPDNPQHVNWDPALAAPGMYTFSHVPASLWYYVEADHNGNKWYAIFYMPENAGTVTRNVAIPPLTALNGTALAATVTPTATLAATPTVTPLPSSSPTPVSSPGFTSTSVAPVAILALFILKTRR